MKKLIIIFLLSSIFNITWAYTFNVKYPDQSIERELNRALDFFIRGYSGKNNTLLQQFDFNQYNQRKFEIIDCEKIHHYGLILYFSARSSDDGVLGVYIELKNGKPINSVVMGYSNIESLIDYMKTATYNFNSRCI